MINLLPLHKVFQNLEANDLSEWITSHAKSWGKILELDVLN